MNVHEGELIHLGTERIDLADERGPTLVDVVLGAAVRRAAARALDELERRHHHGPWIVVCTATAQVIAASPSFDTSEPPYWKYQLDTRPRLAGDAPLALLCLGEDSELADDDPAAVAAHWVERGLSEIAVAERRAAVADMRAGHAEALATTDALTGLANQRAWWNRISEEDERMVRSDSMDVIAIIDLDDLKAVNDERGHLHGDLLIRLTAMTLRNAVRPYDVLARVGGDEFAVLALDFEGEPSALSGRIIAALAEAGIEASVGVACSTEGMALTEVYAAADRAMYAHKRSRRQQSAAEA